MYNQTRYQSVKEFAEVTSNENYRKWKASYEESIINQAGNERGVQHRKELLKTIKEKVNPNDSTYFQNKLRIANTPYSELILKSLRKGKVDEDAATKTLRKYADLDHQDDPVLDTSTTPSSEIHKRLGTFMPANQVDLQTYYKYRPTMTFREYDLIKKQEYNENLWRDNWNKKSKYEVEIDNVSLDDLVERLEKRKIQRENLEASLEQGNAPPKNTVFVSDVEGSDTETTILRDIGLETKEEVFELNLDRDALKLPFERKVDLVHDILNHQKVLGTLGLEDPLQDDKDRLYQQQRQSIREAIGSVGKEKGFHFDAPTLDLQRDFNYEKQQRFKQSKQYDMIAWEKTHDNNFNLALYGKDIVNQMQMAPKVDPEEERIDEYVAAKIREEFQEIKNWRKENIALRVKISSDFAQLKQQYITLLKTRQDLVKIQKDKVGQYEHHAPTRGINDFVAQQQNSEQLLKQKTIIEEFYKLQQLMQKNYFDPESSSQSMYEQELHFLSRKAILIGADYSHQFEFVFDCIKKNGVEQSNNIKARMFEYSVLVQQKEFANTLLSQLASQPTSTQPINSYFLQSYFTQCAKTDNLDGIAHLTNYCEKHGVDVSEWDISQLRTGLNYYLNTNFNLSKVLIFTKFYSAFYNFKQNKVLQNIKRLSKKNQKKAYDAIFGKFDGLVDMKATFGFLVEHIGSEAMIDPVTKQDILMNLVDTFTRNPKVYMVSQLSSTSTIDSKHIAQYLASQFSRPNSLQQVLSLAMRLDDTSAGVPFTDSLLRHLRDYQTMHNGQLPFSKDSIRKLYITLRATNQLKQDQASTELLLFMLKQAGLNEEVIDYCSHSAKSSQVKQYYLSEALLAMKLKKQATYSKLLTQADLIPTDKPTALQLTQATKAMFLDQGGDAGIAYFNSQKSALKQEQTARENMFVSIYDSVFKSPETTSLEDFKASYQRSSIVASRLVKESFAVSQLSAIIERKNYDEIEKMFNYYTLLKEERALQKKYDGFQDKKTKKELQNVQDRRKIVGNELAMQDIEALESIATAMKDDKIELLSTKSGEHLSQYASLFKQMTVDDVTAIQDRLKRIEMKKRYKHQFIDVTDSEPEEDVLLMLDSIINEKKYGLELQPLSDDEAKPYSKEQDQLLEGAVGETYSESDIDQWGLLKDKKASMRKENKSSDDEEESKELTLTPEQSAQVDKKVQKYMEDFQKIEQAVEATQKVWKPTYQDDQITERLQDADQLPVIEFKRPGEPNLKRPMQNHEHIDQVFKDFQAHFFNLIEKQAELRNIGVPSEQQQKEMKDNYMFRKHMNFRQKERKGQEHHNMAEADKKKYEKWVKNEFSGPLNLNQETVNDPELLIAEAYNTTLYEMKDDLIKALSRRRQHVLPIALNIFNKLQEKQFKTQSLEYQRVQHESQVTDIDANLEKLHYLINDHRSPVVSALVETEHYSNNKVYGEFEYYYKKKDDYDTPLDYDHFQRDNERLVKLNSEVADMTSSLSVIQSKLFSKKLEVLASDVFETKRDPDFSIKHDEMIENLYSEFKKSSSQTDKTQKVKFMQNALALHLGENNIETAFPQFYALDLVHFGVEKRIPEAVRLGEQLLAEQDAKMPVETAKIVRQFLLDGSNNQKYRQGMKSAGPASSQMYHQTSSNSEPIFCLDDPYWRDFLLQNSKREDQWRTPSMLAWRHRPYGIIGEVVDVEKMRSKFQSML